MALADCSQPALAGQGTGPILIGHLRGSSELAASLKPSYPGLPSLDPVGFGTGRARTGRMVRLLQYGEMVGSPRWLTIHKSLVQPCPIVKGYGSAPFAISQEPLFPPG